MRNAISAECCIERGDAGSTVKGYHLIVSSVFFDLLMPVALLSTSLFLMCNTFDDSSGAITLFLWSGFALLLGYVSNIICNSQCTTDENRRFTLSALRLNVFASNINFITIVFSLIVLMWESIFRY